MSNELAKIDDLLQKVPENRPSYYQLKYFVLGQQPTTQKQLWQCLIELQSRKESMDNLSFDIAEQKDRLELLRIDIEGETNKNQSSLDTLDSRKDKIKLNILKRQEEKMIKNINSLENKLKFVEQEAKFFVQAFESLSKVEEMKDFDDFEAQAEFWNSKVAEEINLRLISKQGLSPDLIKTALSLHDGSSVKEQTLKLMEKFEQLKMGANEQVIECRQTI